MGVEQILNNPDYALPEMDIMGVDTGDAATIQQPVPDERAFTNADLPPNKSYDPTSSPIVMKQDAPAVQVSPQFPGAPAASASPIVDKRNVPFRLSLETYTPTQGELRCPKVLPTLV
jgi:hypothetical protein